jgi:hypothetical protein
MEKQAKAFFKMSSTLLLVILENKLHKIIAKTPQHINFF